MDEHQEERKQPIRWVRNMSLIRSADGNNVVVVLKKDTTIPNDMNADWIKKHVAVYGKEPNPFDGV